MTPAQYVNCLADIEQMTAFRRYCFYRAGNLHDGDEMANHALLRGWEKCDTIHDCTHLWPWLRRVAINYFISQRRGTHREQLTGDAEIFDGDVEDIRPDELAAFDGPTLHAALMSLNELQRCVIIMARVEDMSWEEIGDELQISFHQVKNSLNRGLQALRKALLASQVRIRQPTDSTQLPVDQSTVQVHMQLNDGLPDGWRLFVLLHHNAKWCTPATPLMVGNEREFVHQLALRPPVDDGQPFQIHAVVANADAAKKLREATALLDSLPTGAVDSHRVCLRFQAPDSGRAET